MKKANAGKRPFMTKPAGCFLQVVGGAFLVYGVTALAGGGEAGDSGLVALLIGSVCMLVGGISARRHMKS
jgi:hypothetical protein